MLPNNAIADHANASWGSALIVLVEIEYEPGQYIRFARHNTDVTFEGVTWVAFPIGPIETSQSVQGEIPAFDIAISNIGREMMSILELYQIENRKGRLLWVHPDELGDPTAKIEEPFVVVSATANAYSATITVAPVNFDPLGVQVPNALVTIAEFPGILGNRSRYLV